MSPSRPLFTVIIATYNAEKKLDRCLTSIARQTFSDIEVIVIDGGSTDGTLRIINAYRQVIAYHESTRDRGIYHAWNKALGHATGEWICFLGADDFFWNRSILASLVPYLETARKRNVALVYGLVAMIDGDAKLKCMRGKTWHRISGQFRHGMPLDFQHTGILHHRSLFQKYGGFDESFLISGDYEFLLRVLKTSTHTPHFANNLCVVAKEDGGISVTDKLTAIREFARAKQQNGIFPYSWFWIAVYARALLFHALGQLKKKNAVPVSE